jgi:HTH-type transcriptional repressor of NAD biosynthesis genes
MKRGLIVGKFYPPHAGHHYLIETGEANCDELTVLVCHRPEHVISGEQRAAWLRQAHPNVIVRVIDDKLDDSDSPGWATFSLKEMGDKIDVVFTSESYGKPWAEAIGCEHFQVDIDRATYPCSGTAIRKDPYKMWNYLSDPVKAYFAFRVCVVGAESTGKTTLSIALASHYQTCWVPEYGRIYTEENIKDVWNYSWKSSDFKKIAKTQAQLEDEAATQANKILVCDTDVFATSIWHKRYMGSRSPAVETLAAHRPPMALYILTDPTTPFDQDGYRDGHDIRDWMHQQFVDSLTMWNKNYIYVSGTPEERLQQAIQSIDKLMQLNTGISGKELTL